MILEIILTIIIGFYLFGLLAKYLLRYWIKRQMNKFQNQTGANFGGASFGGATNTGSGFGGANDGGSKWKDNSRKKSKDGVEIKLTNMGNQQRKISKDVGEYVEFDEVK